MTGRSPGGVTLKSRRNKNLGLRDSGKKGGKMGNNAEFYKFVNESYQHGGQGLHNVLFHVVILLDCT